MAVPLPALALGKISSLWTGCGLTNLTLSKPELVCLNSGGHGKLERSHHPYVCYKTDQHKGQPLSSRRKSRVFRIRAQEEERELAPHTGKEDVLLQGLSANAEVSVFAIVATNLVKEAQARHHMAPTAAAALGRALMGTLLLGSFRKDDETVQVIFTGEGPLGQMTVVANSALQVKGMVQNPACDLPLNSLGKLDVGGAVGPGVLTVVRNSHNWKQPYSGSVDIVCGEVAEDLTHYLAESEQQNSAMGLGVLVDIDCTVAAAGGFLVQVLPFCSEETLSILEANVTALPSPTKMLMDGLHARDIVARILAGLGQPQFTSSAVPTYGPCGTDNLRERMMRTLVLLGPQQIQELIYEQVWAGAVEPSKIQYGKSERVQLKAANSTMQCAGAVEVKCEFCSEVIRFEEDDLLPVMSPK